MDKRIKQHRALSLKLSVALVVVADLEGRESWRTSGPGCGSRHGPRAEHGRDPGGPMWEGLSVFWLKTESKRGKEYEYLHSA